MTSTSLNTKWLCWKFLLMCGLLLSSGLSVYAGTPHEHFEKKIRPLLVKHCYGCHSADADELGGKLALDTTEGIKAGGETGRLFVAKNVEESLIIQAIKYQGLEMPPEQPLSEAEIHEFEQWINKGGFVPETKAKIVAKDTPPTKSDHWSFQKEVMPELPNVKQPGWVKEPLDRFILSRMTSAGFSPAPRATPRILIRRLYLDLHGLLPSDAEITNYVKECEIDHQAATEKLVEKLLASPHFGERWGRHWLDVARYAESNGNDGLGRNHTFPHAWRYRDYVINAFNDDRPYNVFVTEQIAGDLLKSKDPELHDRQIIATGFLAMTAKPAKAMNNNFEMDVVADQLDVVGKGFLGLSIGCARCHDHKFDPIPTREYYAMAGFFTNCDTLWGPAANEKLTAPPTDLHVLKATPKNLPPKGFVETVLVIESATGIPKKVPKSKWAPGTPLAMGVKDKKKIQNCKINIKGNAKKTGGEVPRGFLTACSLECPDIKIDNKSSGRLQLAKWITHPQHPLTSRVFVNRVWLHLLGNGIVQTPDDFGVYGYKPTHPELLDYLSLCFKREGWSVKKLIRHIVLSSTYQQESQYAGVAVEKDPQNLYYARYLHHRMDAETIRDCMLQACGELDLDPRKGSLIQHRDILMNLAGNLHEPDNHRSIYLCYLRNSMPPELTAFDLPEFTSTVGKRSETTLPNQALYLFNNKFLLSLSESYARKTLLMEQNAEDRIRLAFLQIMQREPSAEELYEGLKLINQLTEIEKSSLKAWAGFTQGLLMTNEFRYVD